MASRVLENLPQASQTIHEVINLFQSKGLSIADMVALSGAHSVGASHCREFMSRIYHFNQTHEIDPTIDKDYAMKLRATCPDKGLDLNVMAFNDPTTPWTLDTAYYDNIRKGMGLLATDQALYSRRETKNIVEEMANDKKVFRKRFGEAMNKMSSFGVKTGTEGEIRRDCRVFNQ
ncbi:hypothetical protein MLD38_009884 [Melastoma candidum]|nr:hypothetical protein MLD38_009884 [Melastoma candidum]